MKKHLFALLALLTLISMPLSGREQKLPEVRGDSGPKILIFSGMRPWLGEGFGNIFTKAKAQVVCLNGPYLDGLSGAPIRQHMNNTVEPEPIDGITPAFERLKRFRLVIFHLIPQQNMEKLFTPERIEKLKTYITNGGNVLFSMTAPENLGELMPCDFDGYETLPGVYSANRPQGDKFALFPEKMPVFRKIRVATPKQDAEVLSMVCDPSGTPVSVYIARKKIGKGSVTFFNAEKNNPTQVQDYSNWAFANAFFVALAADCANLKKLKPENCITTVPALPEAKLLDEVAVSVQLPESKLVENSADPVITGNSATFRCGSRITVDESGKISAFLPNQVQALFSYGSGGGLTLQAAKQRKFDSKTAEAVDVKEEMKSIDQNLKLTKIYAENGCAVLEFASKNSLVKRYFKPAKFYLDGREFASIGEKIKVEKAPQLLSRVQTDAKLTPPEPLFARSMACYRGPRGYSEFDMSGKTKGDTNSYGIISGQPFEYIVCQNGVFIAHATEIASIGMQLKRDVNAPAIDSSISFGFGRLPAPQETVWYWRSYSPGKERATNDYIAIYQYQRQTMRRNAGLDELPAYPTLEISYKISKDEQLEVVKFAADHGYRYVMFQNPESPIEKLIGRKENCELIKSYGLKAYQWSAGSYTQGVDGWIYQNHPDWFAKDENGNLFRYFGSAKNIGYPVIDINNQEFLDWYMKLVEPLFEAGMGWIYRDMDAAASGTTNFSLPTSPNGIASQIKVYRFFHDHNCLVGIEGMNPLVIDQFWYRADLYAPFTGKEFALIGMAPWCDVKGALSLDPFILGMYGCFPRFEMECTALGVSRVDGEVERGLRIASLARPFTEALDNTGMPFIRDTPFGTSWIGDKGGALCFFHPVKKVTVELPANYRIKGVDGNTLTDVPKDTIILLEKIE